MNTRVAQLLVVAAVVFVSLGAGVSGKAEVVSTFDCCTQVGVPSGTGEWACLRLCRALTMLLSRCVCRQVAWNDHPDLEHLDDCMTVCRAYVHYTTLQNCLVNQTCIYVNQVRHCTHTGAVCVCAM